MLSGDTYRTIAKASGGVLYKDKGSKFFAYAFPVTEEAAIKKHLDQLKKEHHAARHWCYAWQLGTDTIRYRANDDGEPTHSAGQPIYGQILSKELSNVLVVVVRYFGGTKLGVGGLINAYRTSAKQVLDACKLLEKTVNCSIELFCEYEQVNKVMRIVKEHQLNITNQQMANNCRFQLSVRKRDYERIANLFSGLRGIRFSSSVE